MSDTNIIPHLPVYAYSSSTIYCGDLHPDVSESMLFEKFSKAGPVISIRICRDLITGESLGYAYINFRNPADAEKALDTCNFDVMKGRPVRLMWSQRDPTLRKSGVGNIFIKNLDKSIDNKDMYDTFSSFGTILSCKVAMDEKGNSKGYGFVHFETAESAKKAIEKVNGMLLSDKILFVGHFIPRRERERMFANREPKFWNVYVKNIPVWYTEENLKGMFDSYGTITSVYVAREPEENKSRGFGFVCFEYPEYAAKAVEEMNGREIEDKLLYVGRAQRKPDRTRELKQRFEQIKRDKASSTQQVNLYVKNLVSSFTDEQLIQIFQEFGSITSAKVMRYPNGKGKGFGFVCFSAPEEAASAVTVMAGRSIFEGGRPLYVALAQRKEERMTFLSNEFMKQMNEGRREDPRQQYRYDQHPSTHVFQQHNNNMYYPQMHHHPQAQRIFHAQPIMQQHQRWLPPQIRQATLQIPQGYPTMLQMQR